jgi:hypothetical protein
MKASMKTSYKAYTIEDEQKNERRKPKTSAGGRRKQQIICFHDACPNTGNVCSDMCSKVNLLTCVLTQVRVV